MIRFWWCVAFLCWLLIGGLAVLIQGKAWDNQGLSEVLSSPDCSGPCFMGIYARTSGTDVYQQVKTHAWVEDVSSLYGTVPLPSLETYAVFNWHWSKQVPTILRSIAPDGGVIDIEEGKLGGITMRTRMPLGAIWLSLGSPGYGYMVPPDAKSNGKADAVIFYFDRWLVVQAMMNYPVTLDGFWNAPVELIFFVAMPPPSYYKPCWLRCHHSP